MPKIAVLGMNILTIDIDYRVASISSRCKTAKGINSKSLKPKGQF